jgi:thioesterase domain-containing protein/acyl carrier protein
MNLKNVEDIYPLSPLQESFLYHALAVADSRVGFEQKTTTLRGELDLRAFEHTWQKVVARHPVLRTSFLWERLERPLQVVRQSVEVPLRIEDLRGLDAEEQRRRVAAFCEADLKRGFDLRKAPLLRLALLRLGDDVHELVWSYHHLVLDAWCRSVMLQEVFRAYDALRYGERASLPTPRPFRDYIAWIERQDLGEAEAFWRRNLEGVPVPTPFGIDRATAGRRSAGPASGSRTLSAVSSVALRDFARRHQLTLNILIQGAWGLLLSRYSGRRDVVFGCTVSGRPAELPGIESMTGMFINNLPLRVEVPPRATALDWLRTLREQSAGLRDYEFCSPVQIRKWSGVAGGQRLYESLLLFQNYPIPRSLGIEVQDEVAVGPMQSRLETSYPLTLVVIPVDRLRLEAVYDGERFDAASIHRLLGHLEVLLGEVVHRPAAPLAQLSLLSAAERQQIVIEWSSADDNPGLRKLAGTVRLLDQDRQPVPVGLAAEIHLAGTATRELGRWLPDGRVERLDSFAELIETAGHLMAPAEIEALLELHPGVGRAAVLLRRMATGSARLAAYVTAGPAQSPEPAELRRFLQRFLPESLVPIAFAILDELPLREDGRLDRGRLPTPEQTFARLRQACVPPRSALELRLVRLWEDLFGLSPIGTTDDFFELGGHSSLAVQLVDRIRRELGWTVPLITLLQSRTVKSLAAALEEARNGSAPLSPLVEIQPGTSSEAPLFCVHPGGGGVLCYVDLAYCLGPHYPVYGLKARGWEDGQEPSESVEEMASAYIEAIREAQPAGPYRLAGWSFGALVALEMAQQLYRRGEEVRFLASFDAGVGGDVPELDDAEILREFIGDRVLDLLTDEGAGLSIDELRRQGGIDEQIVHLLAVARRRDLLPADFDLPRVRSLFAVRRANFKAASRYELQPYQGRVTLFRAAEGRILFYREPTLGWHRIALGGVEIHEVSCTHDNMVRRPWVEALAELLRGCLETSEALVFTATN